jgi:hypothetical protein
LSAQLPLFILHSSSASSHHPGVLLVESGAMPFFSLPQIAGLLLDVRSDRQLGDVDGIQLFCKDGRLAHIRPPLTIYVSRITADPAGSFGPVLFGIPDKENFSSS